MTKKGKDRDNPGKSLLQFITIANLVMKYYKENGLDYNNPDASFNEVVLNIVKGLSKFKVEGERLVGIEGTIVHKPNSMNFPIMVNKCKK